MIEIKAVRCEDDPYSVDETSEAGAHAPVWVIGWKTMIDRIMAEMVRNQRPLTLHKNTTVAETCRHMNDRRAGAVMMTDTDGHLLGILTGRDAVRTLAQGYAPDSRPEAVMTRSPSTIAPDRPVIDALRLMQGGEFPHLPVVDREQVVGVVSWGDFRTSEHDQLETEINLWERI